MILQFVNLILIIVLFLLHTSFITSAFYLIPTPIIRVFRPRGFEVSIPHVEGMQKFVFSANLNVPLTNDNDPRQIEYSKSVCEPDPAGRMTLQDRVARIRLGDKFYYRLMVTKDDEDYFLSDQVFIVRVSDFFKQPNYNPEVEEYYRNHTIPIIPNNRPSTTLPDNNQYLLPQTTTTTTKPYEITATKNNNTELDDCNEKIYSLVEKVSWLVTEIDRLTDENRLLYKIGNSVPDGKRLFLSGKISSTDDPTQIAMFVLNEKLGMTPTILNAKRNDENLIQFEVESLDVKLDILMRAGEKFAKTKSINIFD